MNRNEQAPAQNSLENFSEPEAVRRLSELGVENVRAAFRIPDEKDINGETISDAEIFWVKIGVPQEAAGISDMLPVEGKVYIPKANANREAIIFTPGFPGGNAGRFEQRYAKTFVDAGYVFATVRHNGASLTNGATSAEILNSAKRMEVASQAGEHHIGGTRPEGYSPSGMIKEPINMLAAFYKNEKFDRIHFMGQSMGVSSNYNAVTQFNGHPMTEKIGNIVSISGYVGDTSETPDGVWSGMKKDFNRLAGYEFGYMEKVDLNAPRDPKWYASEMKKVAEANEHMQVPSHVGNILIFTPADPLIAGPDKTKEGYALNYGPKSRRKLIIEDGSMPLDQAKKAHSMLWIAPENLLRAVQSRVSERGPHYVKIPKTGLGLVGKA